MEQTLGQRIAGHRKRLHMTQEQLAEKLGITAQAVSKWENDQSCPDIAMLPQLAEIFGVSIDSLLGKEETPPVCEAEVVAEDSADETQDSDGGLVLLSKGQRSAIAFALLVLWVGGWTLACQILDWDVSFGSILWTSAVVWIGIKGICKKFSAFRLLLIVFGTYFFLNYLPLWQLEIQDAYVFPIIVLALGMGLLLDALFKPRKAKKAAGTGKRMKYSMHIDDNKMDDFQMEDGYFRSSLSFCDGEHVVMTEQLAGGNINVNHGHLILDLTQVREVAPDCYMEANCALGELIVVAPRRFAVEFDHHAIMAEVKVEGAPDPNPDATIRLEANVSMGQVTLRYQ